MLRDIEHWSIKHNLCVRNNRELERPHREHWCECRARKVGSKAGSKAGRKASDQREEGNVRNHAPRMRDTAPRLGASETSRVQLLLLKVNDSLSLSPGTPSLSCSPLMHAHTLQWCTRLMNEQSPPPKLIYCANCVMQIFVRVLCKSLKLGHNQNPAQAAQSACRGVECEPNGVFAY